MTVILSDFRECMIGKAPLIVIIVFGSLRLLFGAGNEVISLEIRLAMSRLSKERIMAHVSYLGSDRLEGRGTGRKGGALAAAYLAEEMERIGLKPMGNDTSFFQRIPMQGSFPLASSSLRISRGVKNWNLSLGHDYLLYEMGSQTHIPKPVPLVFAGYGIVAPEYDYNDYQHIDVDGAVVVFLDGEPFSEDPQWFDGRRPTIHSLPKLKQRIAASRGALGSIVIPSNREGKRPWSYWVTTFEFEHVVLPYQVPANLSLLWNPDKAGVLFEGARYNFKQVLAMDAGGLTRSFSLQTRISFRGRFREREFTTVNVAGLLEGRDPLLRDSYVIVSAHYDHLGIGPPVRGDVIYNGVVDNALGVAAALEIARVYRELSRPPRRSLLFLLLTGEEKGLLGSLFYCNNPLVPLHQTIANINIDGLAVLDIFEEVVGVGAEHSTLDRHLQSVAGEMNLSVAGVPPIFFADHVFSRSDQLSFAQAGIPSILIMEGFEYRNLSGDAGARMFLKWGETRYHTPFDDLSQPLNLEAVLHHCKILTALTGAVANTFTPPQWTRGTEYMNARLRTIAEKR